jgi:4'-phosphopantetheinyl transferase EntD
VTTAPLESAARALFGAGVRVAAASIDAAERFAFDEERRAIARAVDSRRREFATGRRLAHALLGELGFAAAPLLPGADRAPLWPDGAVGSIAHDRRACVVAVAQRRDWRSLGIDLEPAEPLPDELWAQVLLPEERAALDRLPARRGVLARLVFSAKECAYKALAPHVRTILEFHDVRVDLGARPVPAEAGACTAFLLREGLAFDPRQPLAVRFAFAAGAIVTAAALGEPG